MWGLEVKAQAPHSFWEREPGQPSEAIFDAMRDEAMPGMGFTLLSVELNEHPG